MKKESKREQRKQPKHIRDAQKAREAQVYSEGFRHGYEMGLKEGEKYQTYVT